MRILIVGAGIVGFNLAEELSHEGHDIAIIDEDAEKIKIIADKLDVLSVMGNACLPSVLLQARIKKVEMVIAVTEKDEVNLMVCFLAHKFNVKERFARLRHLEFTSEDRVFDPSELYVDHAINPGEIIIETILGILKTPGAVNVAEFANGEILLRGFDVDDDAPIANKTIEELRGVSEFNSFLVIAIVRDGSLVIPHEKDIIKIGDKIYILVDDEMLPLVLPMLNRKVDEVQKIVIFGANQVSINLARKLETFISDLSIIEPNIDRANQAADRLSHAMVLHGNGTDTDIFNDINIHDADMFLSLSDDDESNILSALLAKKYGAKRAIVISNDPDYLPILHSIGMDATINPRLITVSAILKHLRKGQVVNVHKLIEGEAEIMEILASPDSTAVNKKIHKLKIPRDAMVGAILRNGEMLVPNGETVIEAGDSVIVVTLPKSLEKIEKIFGGSHHFLG